MPAAANTPRTSMATLMQTHQRLEARLLVLTPPPPPIVFFPSSDELDDEDELGNRGSSPFGEMYCKKKKKYICQIFCMGQKTVQIVNKKQRSWSKNREVYPVLITLVLWLYTFMYILKSRRCDDKKNRSPFMFFQLNAFASVLPITIFDITVNKKIFLSF